jgi:hypothetical protein
MQRSFVAEPLDCRDFRTVLHHGEHQARVYAPAGYQYRAATALAVIAALFGSREVEVIAQRVKKSGPRSQLNPVSVTIDP